MFNWLKNSGIRRLEKKHQLKYEQAVSAQRNGNIRLYSKLVSEAEQLMQKIDEEKKKKALAN